MKDKLSQIFAFRKTTYDSPSMSASTGTFEQDTLFVDINEAQCRVTSGMGYCRVTGSLICFAQMDKLPFGYFNKRIQQAEPDLTRKFFFFDIDLNPSNSPARVQNITERRVRFVYLYSGQYDPAHGELTSIQF